MNTARVVTEDLSYQDNQGYISNPVRNEGSIIEGYFYKENLVKEMAIRKVNKSLCGILIIAILGVIVSYYFSMTSELSLNVLSRKITTLNDENAELQNHLDRLKSFNNVDNKIAQFNVLQKPESVIEVEAIPATPATAVAIKPTKVHPNMNFFWSVGY